ncbi:MAG: hypothetical protein IJQ76_08305 [Prevotella sp.]|nr:hypothetical protein [Prevotella sp.]
MKYNIRLTAFAATALLFAACTQTELDDSAAVVASQNGDNAVIFGTYMSGNEQTRAGYQGSITTNTLKDLDADGNPVVEGGSQKRFTNGFGVFGYYTGNTAYAQATKANFMYNEHVYYDKDATEGYISNWVYAPMKFWPNEVKDGSAAWKVDDQDNDASDNQAYTDGGKGGNVSFFAYAPYVELKTSDDLASNEGGIIKINDNARYGGNSKVGNPTVEYVVASKGEKVVDLLWGTAGTASAGVTGAANTGVAASSDASATDYQKAILPGYMVNADLTKQKTTGKVEFAFKHALAKVGGSTIYSNNPSGVSQYGLMVVLDLDDQKGAEGGGKMEANPGGSGYPNTTKAPKLTKVTVQDVQIVGRSQIPHDGKNPGEEGYVARYLKNNQGTLDLATGKWSLANGGSVTTGEATVTHKITSDASSTADKEAKAGVLSTKIAEPAALTNPTPADAAQRITNFEDLPVGVTTTAQNVYESEAYPLVFIPGTYPELTITVTYTVRTYDPNLYRKYTEVTQKITKKVTFKQAVELNKQYSLLMHLGLTSVKFSASVADWDHTVITPDGSESGATAVAEEAVEHIYIPRNVGDTDLGTATIISHTNGKTYAIIFEQEGREPGDLYFSTSKPITIKAYEVNNETGTKTAVSLNGNNPGYGINVLCTGNNSHFNGSITYNSGNAQLNTPAAEVNIVHAPVTITFVVNGSATSVKSNIYIWPESKLPYFLK